MTQDAIANPPASASRTTMETGYISRWAKTGELAQAVLSNGFTLRYLKDGKGPPLLLMHTARSQLDYFQRLIPHLVEQYTVYAIDLPGHGWSTIRRDVSYVEPLFRESIKQFIEVLGLDKVTLAGDSVGAVLSLTVSAELPDRVMRAVAVNLFDYPGGVQRSNAIARLVVGSYQVPMINLVVSNLENLPVLRAILEGGFADKSRLPHDLLREFRRVGRRRGYPRMARSLFSAMPSFIAARELYKRVSVPVTLVYGASDWSKPEEREANLQAVPGAKMVTLEGVGHFASLERPEAIARVLLTAPS